MSAQSAVCWSTPATAPERIAYNVEAARVEQRTDLDSWSSKWKPTAQSILKAIRRGNHPAEQLEAVDLRDVRQPEGK